PGSRAGSGELSPGPRPAPTCSDCSLVPSGKTVPGGGNPQAAGRTGRPCPARADAAPAALRPLGRRRGPRRPACLRRRTPRRRRQRSRGRRERLPGEGPVLGRRAEAVHRHRGTHRKRPGRRVPRPGHRPGTGPDRPPALPARALLVRRSRTPSRGRGPRGHPVRDQAPTGLGDARRRAGRRDHRVLGDRRRSLRPGPPAPRRPGGTRHRLRAGRRLLGAGEDQPRPHRCPRGHRRRPPARCGLAPSERRQRGERPALLRLGLDPHRHRQPPAPAHPPQPGPRRTRLLPVLVTHRSAPVGAGPRRRCPLERGGVLPGRQGPGRTRPLPGPQLDLLAPAHHARHACPGLPDRPRLRRGPRAARRYTPPRPQPRSHRVDRPGDPPPPRRRLRPSSRDRGQTAALVHLAPAPPGNSPTQSLPTTTRQRILWI
ncbi:LOW QUALITY PROTEIN: transposase IS4 family protein, partial [Streptomyces viridosporus ATCC 14672]